MCRRIWVKRNCCRAHACAQTIRFGPNNSPFRKYDSQFAHKLGKRGPPNKKGAPPPPPQPEGTGKKRTPTSAFDPAASKDVYEPEKIIGQRLSKGVTTFNVKWVGWADKDNTWEPIEQHLVADCDLAQCRIELQPQEAARSTPPTRTILQSTIKNQRCTVGALPSLKVVGMLDRRSEISEGERVESL